MSSPTDTTARPLVSVVMIFFQAERFIVEAIESGLGIHVRDLRSQAELLVLDLGLGSSAEPGLILATRIVSVAGIHMTGGAAIPLGKLPNEGEDLQFWQKFTT